MTYTSQYRIHTDMGTHIHIKLSYRQYVNTVRTTAYVPHILTTKDKYVWGTVAQSLLVYDGRG